MLSFFLSFRYDANFKDAYYFSGYTKFFIFVGVGTGKTTLLYLCNVVQCLMFSRRVSMCAITHTILSPNPNNPWTLTLTLTFTLYLTLTLILTLTLTLTLTLILTLILTLTLT